MVGKRSWKLQFDIKCQMNGHEEVPRDRTVERTQLDRLLTDQSQYIDILCFNNYIKASK